LRVDGHEYLVATISGKDARDRDIASGDLIRLWNHRGSVVCAAFVTDRVQPGVVSAPTASAEYRPAGEPGNSTDLGGCVNMLNSSENMTEHTHSIKPNTTLIQMEKWTGVDTWQRAEAV
jgi:trimethylamine-N-oxide reductase (cytochrome c)